MRSSLVCAVVLALAATPCSTLHARETISAEPGSLAHDKVQQLLAEPTLAAASGELDRARSTFAEILANARRRYGHTSVQVADLISSFGLSLVATGFWPGREAQKELGREYLHTAVAAYRAALSPIDPALADALQTEAAFFPEDAVSSEAESLLEEALQIRLKALGEEHPDTRNTMSLLAQRRGAPARTQGDPLRVEAAAQAFRTLINMSPEVMTRGNLGDSAAAVRFQLAAMYARNGMMELVISEATEARKQILKWPAQFRCGAIEIEMGELERALEHADKAQVENLKAQIVEASPSDCAADTLP